MDIDIKNQVGLLLQRIQPKLLAVDLDNTLWPGNCFESTTGPYVCNQLLKAPRTVACLDPRTGRGKTLSLFPDVREILEFLASKGVVLTVCSRSPNRIAAKGILDTLGLWGLFVLPQVYRSRKTYHFRNLRDCLDVEYRDCLHFDDCANNIEAVSTLGVVAYQVQLGVGLTWESLLAGLQMYEQSHSIAVESYLQPSSRLTTGCTSQQASSGKRVRWCLNPTYFEDSTSEPEKTDGDESTDDTSSCDEIASPPADAEILTMIGVKRKLSPLAVRCNAPFSSISSSSPSQASKLASPSSFFKSKRSHFSFPESILKNSICS